jgi:hypothetical protein
MKYAIWNLDTSNSENITGPEALIAQLGGQALGGWVDGEAQEGADILGYVTGEFPITSLTAWNYREVTSEEALEFAQAINTEAFFTPDLYISQPLSD